MRDLVHLNNDAYEYSEREFSSLDAQIGSIAAGLRSMRKAQTNPLRSEDVKRHFNALRLAQSSERERDPQYDEDAEMDAILAEVAGKRTRKTASGKKAKREVPDSFKEHQFKAKGAEDDDCDDEDEDCDDDKPAFMNKKANSMWGGDEGGKDSDFDDEDMAGAEGSGFGGSDDLGDGDNFGGGNFGGDDSDDFGGDSMDGLDDNGNFSNYAGDFMGGDDESGFGPGDTGNFGGDGSGDDDEDDMSNYDHEFGDFGRSPRGPMPKFSSNRATKPTRRARKRVIEFTSEDQLSTEALENARRAGDAVLHRTILAARDARRDYWASKIEKHIEAEQAALTAERQASAAKNKSIRLKVATAATQTAATNSTRAKQIAKSAQNNGNDNGGIKVAFKKPSEMDTAERRAMMQFAVAEGFPEKAVLAMFARTAAKITDQEKQIQDILSSELDPTVKKAACIALTRTAKLDTNQSDRLKRFWEQELGYNDEGAHSWVEDWLSGKYNSEGNGNGSGSDKAAGSDEYDADSAE